MEYQHAILKIKKQPNWAGSYRIDYDGKHGSLIGKDSRFEVNGYGFSQESGGVEYEDMVLAFLFEARNADARIVAETNDFLYIDVFYDLCVDDAKDIFRR